MVQRLVRTAVFALALTVGLTGTAAAQQAVTVQLGAFMPKGEGGRASGDVLVVNRDYLLFNFGDFNGFTVSGDWSVALGEFAEASAGFGYYQRTVPTVYAEWVNENGSEVQQDLRLKIMPATAVVKILPLGNKKAFQPYIGGGLGIYFWHYSEIGEFVDFTDETIFTAAFEQSGTSVGPVAVFGARGRVSPSSLIGVEGRYQWGKGDLSQDFLGDTIDLGGFSILATFGFRF